MKKIILRNLAKLILEFFITPIFKLKSKIVGHFFDSLERHEKLLQEKIIANINVKQEISEPKSPEVLSAGIFPKTKSGVIRNSAFKVAASERETPNERTSFLLTPSPEKRSLMSTLKTCPSPLKPSPLKSLFPNLFKKEVSSPSNHATSGHSSLLSSPSNASPTIRGISALLRKPSIQVGIEENKILLKIIT